MMFLKQMSGQKKRGKICVKISSHIKKKAIFAR